MFFFSVSSRFLVRFWTVVLLMSLYCGAVFAAEPSSPERGGWFEMPLEASAEPRDGGGPYLGGGDHGGPVCKKVELPKEWDVLCERYPGTMPEYLEY